jgi:hypothetical protein
MKKKINLSCIIISIIPLLLLAGMSNKIILHPNTHIFDKSNGMIIDKYEFFFLIILLGILSFFIAIFISEKNFSAANYKNISRLIVNIIFTSMIIVLIIVNMKRS